MSKTGYVYILTNKHNTTLYIGVTSNLISRIYQHKNKQVEGFTKRYNLTKLVYYEKFDDIKDAITKEKYLKGKKRTYKINLVKELNPTLKDIYQSIL